jgi:hypothetical protein
MAAGCARLGFECVLVSSVAAVSTLGRRYSPTLTDVLPSSSEALLPPPALLEVLIRLLLL